MMKFSTILTSIVVTIVVLAFLIFVLRSCTRTETATSQSSADKAAESSHLTPCTADPATGICSPEEEPEDTFDHAAFMAMVREHQRASSSSSSRGSLLARLAGSTSRGLQSLSGVRSSVSGRFSSLRSRANSASARLRSSSAGTSVSDGSDGGSASEQSFSASESVSVSGSESMAEDEEGFTGHGGLQGSLGPLPSGRCLRGRSLLSIIDLGDVTTGDGVTFSGLIDGDCPISAAILKGPDSNGFGGPLNDF